jgi:hypothetical protein
VTLYKEANHTLLRRNAQVTSVCCFTAAMSVVKLTLMESAFFKMSANYVRKIKLACIFTPSVFDPIRIVAT